MPAPRAIGDMMVVDAAAQWQSAPVGMWTDVPFNAANFYSNGGGVWTVTSVNALAYMLIGKTLWYTVTALGDLTGAPSNTFAVNLPGGFTIAKETEGHVTLYTSAAGGSYTPGWYAALSGTAITVFTGNYPATVPVGGLQMRFTAVISIA